MSVSRSIAVNTVGNLTTPVLALATQPLLAHGLGVTGRGELAAATAPLMLVGVILTFGMPEAFTYYVARRSAHLPALIRRGFLLLGLAGIAGTGTIAAIAPVLTDDPALSALIVVAGLGLVPTLIVAGMRGVAQGHQDWRRVALERILGAVARFVAVLVLLLSNSLTPLSATIAVAVTTFAGGAVYLWPRRPSAPDVPGPEALSPATDEDSRPAARDSVTSYGFRVWLGALAGILLLRLDQMLMTPLTATEQIGLYAVAVSVSEVALIFNSSIRDVMFSVEAESPSDRRISLASRLSTLITFALSLAIAIAAPWVFPWLFGEDFAAAVPVLWLLAAAIVLGNPGSIAGVALTGRGRPELRSASIGVAVVVNVVLIALLVPSYGAMGAALATLVGNVVSGNCNILFLQLRFGTPWWSFYRFRMNDLRELRDAVRSLLARKAVGG